MATKDDTGKVACRQYTKIQLSVLASTSSIFNLQSFVTGLVYPINGLPKFSLYIPAWEVWKLICTAGVKTKAHR